ncbi:MAG: hypothetical protein HUK07_07115 [Bacteroidaceae bacterium]|nr:hypothetical protein [Bacteroidaceae bacterium]
MVQELRWLDSKVQENRDNRDWCVRQRIISIGLSNEFARHNNKYMVLAFDALCDYHNNAFDWNGNKLSECYDYSSKSFSAIDRFTSDEIIAYFKSVKQPANTPLAKYVSEKLMQQYSVDYINDVIGTKLLAENKLAEAIPYLKKVSQRYIDNQTIAYYVAHRDYKTPAWYGQQKIDAEEYDDNGNKIVYPLNGNVKVNFCNDVIALQNKFAIADFDVRKQLAYELAGYYYQASFKGQCWFITHYGQSIRDEQNPKEANFPEIARNYLADAATSSNPQVRLAAMFGQVGAAPDLWREESYDENYNTIWVVYEYSKQYGYLSQLDSYLKTVDAIPDYISNCDVLKQFRKQRKH